jgi:uncharacterized OB-fold protein
MIQRDDDEWDDDEACEEDGADETLAECPKCGAEVYDDIEKCPHCGEWIGGLEYAGSSRKRLFVAIVALFLLAGPLFLLLKRLLFK